jgi:hypothetical protein
MRNEDIKSEEPREAKQYETPAITDHGDLTALTAHLGSGMHVDATYTYGQLAGYISGP